MIQRKMPKSVKYLNEDIRHLPGSKFRLNKTDGVLWNKQEHCGLGQDNILCTRYRQDTKKAGRFPIRMHEGPTKNLLPSGQKTFSKTQRYYDPLLVFHIR